MIEFKKVVKKLASGHCHNLWFLDGIERGIKMNIKTGLKAARSTAAITAAAIFSLAAVFMVSAGGTAEAATHHKHHTQHHKTHKNKHHHKRHQDHATHSASPRAHETSSPRSFASGDVTLIFHVRSGRLELNGHVYDAGSGNREGYNNPSMSHVRNRGPVPAGHYTVSPRGAPFHGTEAWRVEGTPGRAGILIHPASVRLRGRPFGESLGCIAVKDNYEQFKRDMHRLHPSHIIIKPG
jgi:hypothetical protein